MNSAFIKRNRSERKFANDGSHEKAEIVSNCMHETKKKIQIYIQIQSVEWENMHIALNPTMFGYIANIFGCHNITYVIQQLVIYIWI